MGVFGRVRDVAEAALDDLRQPDSRVNKGEVVTLMTALALKEAGLGVGATMAMAGLAYKASGGNLPLAMLTATSTSYTIEKVLGSRVAAQLPHMPRTAAVFESWHVSQTSHEGHKHSGLANKLLGFWNRGMTAFVFGAAGIVIHSFFKEPSADRKSLARRGGRVAMGLAALNGVGALAAFGGVKLAEKAGFEEAAQTSLDILTKPWLYPAALFLGVVVKGISHARRRRAERRRQGGAGQSSNEDPQSKK